MKKEVVVNIDGVKIEDITVEEAKEKAKMFSPFTHWKENTFYTDRHAICNKVIKPDSNIGFDLEELIAFLQEVHVRFGNMPVLYFSGRTECFRKFELSDIDIVKSYFTVSGNTVHQFMNIRNDKALTFFHC